MAVQGRDAVLRTFMPDGTITQMPARMSRRLVLLEHVAERFEPGKDYDERQVNALLRPAFDDVAALRRYLVDHRFLTRHHGIYRRVVEA